MLSDWMRENISRWQVILSHVAEYFEFSGDSTAPLF